MRAFASLSGALLIILLEPPMCAYAAQYTLCDRTKTPPCHTFEIDKLAPQGAKPRATEQPGATESFSIELEGLDKDELSEALSRLKIDKDKPGIKK